VVRTASVEPTFRREEILRVSSKSQPHHGRNAAIAAGIGVGVGAGLGGNEGARNGDAGLGALGGGIFGALLGVGTGALLPSGGWHDVYRSR
jgi:hypothetical protein